jgi:hypothetical protein
MRIAAVLPAMQAGSTGDAIYCGKRITREPARRARFLAPFLRAAFFLPVFLPAFLFIAMACLR